MREHLRAPLRQDNELATAAPSTNEIQLCLGRILESPKFKSSSRLGDFLAYIVEETLEGRPDRIKAYAIGIEVFGRDETFDPQVDPVVRIEAGRLRRDIEHYYLSTGRADPIAIDIPKGSYVPKFYFRAQATLNRGDETEPVPHAPEVSPETAPPNSTATWRGWRWKWAGIFGMLAGLFALAWILVDVRDADQKGSSIPSGLLVLPFNNLGGGSDVGRHGEAITGELTAQLAHRQEIAVFSLSSRNPPGLSDSDTWPATKYLLDGSVRANNTRLRVTARLVDRTANTVIWSDAYDIDLSSDDLIAVEHDVAKHVAAAVAQIGATVPHSSTQLSPQLPLRGAADNQHRPASGLPGLP